MCIQIGVFQITAILSTSLGTLSARWRRVLITPSLCSSAWWESTRYGLTQMSLEFYQTRVWKFQHCTDWPKEKLHLSSCQWLDQRRSCITHEGLGPHFHWWLDWHVKVWFNFLRVSLVSQHSSWQLSDMKQHRWLQDEHKVRLSLCFYMNIFAYDIIVTSSYTICTLCVWVQLTYVLCTIMYYYY